MLRRTSAEPTHIEPSGSNLEISVGLAQYRGRAGAGAFSRPSLACGHSEANRRRWQFLLENEEGRVEILDKKRVEISFYPFSKSLIYKDLYGAPRETRTPTPFENGF